MSKWNWDQRKKMGLDTSRRNGQLQKCAEEVELEFQNRKREEKEKRKQSESDSEGESYNLCFKRVK